ncbi:MAG: SpoIIE family protein phosphatase [Clostridia bacterium]|nr:SpoIIE family protein phosphatase [Clostridia bacterium]
MDNKKFRSDIERAAKKVKNSTSLFLRNYIRIEGTKKERREEINLRLNYAARGVGFGAMAFFFGRADLVFASYPLGAALFCAGGKYTPFVYVGLILSSLFVTDMAATMFFIYTMALLFRFVFSYMTNKEWGERLFCEKITYKLMLSSLMMLFFGVVSCVKGGFLWFDFFGLLFGVFAAPILTFLFSGALDSKYKFTSLHDAGLCALMSFCVFSLNGYTLFGFSLSCIAAFTVTLYISKECGMLRGGIAGLFAGLAYNVFYSPLFAVAGVISGLFWKQGSVYAAAGALLSGIAYSVYLDGFTALRSFAPDLLAASLIFTPLAHLDILPKAGIYLGQSRESESRNDIVSVKERQNEGQRERIKAMSDSFSSLSEIFYSLSCVEKKPRADEVKKGVEQSFEKYCKACPRKRICWDTDYEQTASALTALSMQIYEGKRANTDMMPLNITKKCNRMDDIMEEVNGNYSEKLKHALEGSCAEVFSMDYAAISALLIQALNENAKEFEIDTELTQKLKSCARYLNFSASNLCVYGKRKKHIVAGGIDLARVKLGVDEIRRSFERVIKAPLSAPDFSIEGEYITMSLKTQRIYKTEFAHATMKKEKEDINGDSVTFFENGEDYFYSLISDGMGSGRDAALSSRLTGVYIDKMLRAGNKKEQTIDMLNSFLRRKNTENSATVDLLEIDLLNGEACFVKSGAAPSYVLRGSSVFKIASNTMPVGITKELNAEEVKFELQDKDVVLMASDGISASFEDGLWLMDMLANDWARGVSLDEMCQKILDRARERNGERDDMTVGMVRIKKIL